MKAAQVERKIAEAITQLSAECERGIVGERTVDGIPIACYVRLAPNCIAYVQPLVPEQDIFIDICLN
jgi:hypothetical protein